jgi:deoxyadenosine/deoxycytidine kinase
MSRDVDAINRSLDHIANDVQKEVEVLKTEEALGKLLDESDELEKLLESHKTIIVIGGNIGLGKSTTARILSKYGKIPKILEPVEESPLLKKYYTDMAKFGPMLQVHLIDDRLMTLAYEKQRHPNESIVLDRTAYEDPWIFCEVLCNSGLMDEQVKTTCQNYFHDRKNELEKRYGISLIPDLIVLLTQKNPDVGWRRVQSRKREIEVREDAGRGRGLTFEFYTSLHQQYSGPFLSDLKQHYCGPVLRLPQDKVEVSDINNSMGLFYVVKSVKEALKVLYGFSS